MADRTNRGGGIKVISQVIHIYSVQGIITVILIWVFITNIYLDSN